LKAALLANAINASWSEWPINPMAPRCGRLIPVPSKRSPAWILRYLRKPVVARALSRRWVVGQSVWLAPYRAESAAGARRSCGRRYSIRNKLLDLPTALKRFASLKPMNTIETERLVLRRFAPQDAAGLFAYLQAPIASCFLSLTLADLNEMEVSVDVNENDIVRVNTGDTATIEVDAYMGKKFKGVVTEVANSANISGLTVDQVTNFTVKVRVLRESYEQMADPEHPERSVFHPGMSATVDIMTKRVSDVISVPIQSVTTRDTTEKGGGTTGMKGGDNKMEDETEITVKDEKAEKAEKADQLDESDKRVECVFLLDNGKVRLVPVKTGIQDNSYIEIKAGLKVGDQVVSSPYSAIAKFLKDGDPVKVVPKEQLFNKKD
jgi:multidrug efflux pump subunit AcrA (membrane-fusion protein)